jgi:hypothetical protein
VIKRLAPRITQKQGHPEEIVQTPMDNFYIHKQEYKSSTKAISEFQTDSVNKCLTDDCKDCTGSYSNDMFHHRLICLCLCHRKSEKAAADSEILQSADSVYDQ